MTTPNASTPADADIDLHANAMASDDSGLNAGDMMARKANYAGHPQARSLRCNVGRTEQNFRIAAGGALLTAAALAPVSSAWRITFAALGAGELITGITRYCPISQALGINTCRDEEA
ncbi:MAG TPA: DUF2892 domain-containing protein [Opitutus sp.]|nr:DUF2892 domain-containing protein [Opitutus sp.]